MLTLAFGPDGNHLNTAGTDGTIRVWKADSGKLVRSIPMVQEIRRFGILRFSPDGKWMAFEGQFNTVKMLDVSTTKVPFEWKLWAIAQEIVFSPDGTCCAIIADEIPKHPGGLVHRDLKIWDTAAGKQSKVIGERGIYHHGMAFTPDNRNVVFNLVNEIAVFSLTMAKIVQRWPVTNRPGSVALSADGHTLATATDSEIILWELATNAQRTKYPAAHKYGWPPITFSPDGRLLATAVNEPPNPVTKLAKVWDLATGKALAPFRGHTASINALAFSPDSRRLATASADTTVLVWDIPR